MPTNPYRKGGTDVPVTDGGTGASDASGGLSNLGGLDGTAHDARDHAGVTGVGDLTTAAHATLDHSSIPGSGLSLGTSSGTSGSLSLPANTISAVGQYARFSLNGLENANTGNTLTLSFGGTNVLSTTFGNAQAGTYSIRVEVWFTGGTGWVYNTHVFGNILPGVTFASGGATADPTGAISFNFSMTAGDGDTYSFVGGYAHT